MSSDIVVYVAECVRCRKPMGGLTQDELNFVARDMGDGLCFDCDPESAATTPSIFWQWHDGDRFEIDRETFTVQLDRLVNYPPSHVRARERTHDACLSSYTYLNRNSKQRELLANGLEVSICPACDGKGFLSEFGEIFSCASCEGIGSLPVAIVIPLWLVQDGDNDV